MADKALSEAEAKVRTLLQEAGFEAEGIPSTPAAVWGTGARDAIGGFVIWQVEGEPHNVHVVARLNLPSTYTERLADFPDGLLYDIRLGLILLGVDVVGYLTQPLQAITIGMPLYLANLSVGELMSAVGKVRQGVIYADVLIQRALGVPVTPPEQAPGGPAN